MSWRTFGTMSFVIASSSNFGVRCLLACSRFEDRVSASRTEPAMQMLFERRD